jgi:hypothetical protein
MALKGFDTVLANSHDFQSTSPRTSGLEIVVSMFFKILSMHNAKRRDISGS